ncbi:MAG: multicopper oxidase domain-containing protein, partial [Caldimonas sp.]
MNRPVSNCVNQPRRTALLGAVAVTANAAFRLPATAAATPRDHAAIDLHVELRTGPDRVMLRSGEPTRVWRYHGKLLRGDPRALEASAGGWLGPIIRVRRGQRVRVDLINGLPESTITHWHGLHVPDDMDGHPRFVVGQGERYVYEFTVLNRAGTYWFHPHPHGRTGKQVYFGLAGLFLVSDDEEAALDLPTGEQDIVLVIQDRSFDDDNQLVYLQERVETATKPRGGMMGGGGMMRGGGMMGGGMMGRGMGGMMAGMMGMFGDDILVNGRLDPSLPVERR